MEPAHQVTTDIETYKLLAKELMANYKPLTKEEEVEAFNNKEYEKILYGAIPLILRRSNSYSRKDPELLQHILAWCYEGLIQYFDPNKARFCTFVTRLIQTGNKTYNDSRSANGFTWGNHGKRAIKLSPDKDVDMDVGTTLIDEPTPEDKLIQHECSEDIKDLLTLLPQKVQEFLIFKYYHDMTYRDVAVMYGMPTSTVSFQIRRGLQSLREEIETEG